MATPLDYSSNPYTSRPLASVDPIIDATSTVGAIRQIFDFMGRRISFRVGVPDTSFFPFSAICRIEISFPSVTGHGTGFYIGPDLILTAGHNFLHPRHGAATGATIRTGQQNETTYLDSFSVTPSDWNVHPNWASSNTADIAHDLAVIRVRNAPPNGEYFELINYSPAADAPIAVCGYSSLRPGSDEHGNRQHLDIDLVRRLSEKWEMVEYNLQTRGGGSGSPVFANFTNSGSGDYPSTIPVMAVHTRLGDSQLNRGVLLTPDKSDWARGGGIMSVAQSMAAIKQVGGLPILKQSRATLGGLPLSPARLPLLAPVSSQGFSRPLERSWIVTDTDGGMSIARRTFGHPDHDLSGKTTLSVRVPNTPEGGSVRWHIPDADDQTRVLFDDGTASATGTSVTLQSLAAGVAHVDCMVKDASGTTIESNKYVVSSPQFVFVGIDPSVSTFLANLGLASREAAIIAEMKAAARSLYQNVNIRFVYPGDTLPVHLGLASNPAFPGGVEVVPSVYYALITADPNAVDLEASATAGVDIPYRAGLMGRHHAPGQMSPPFDQHAIAVGLLNRLRLIPEVGAIESTLTSSTPSNSDLDLVATMYGRMMGENMSHEVGHFPYGTEILHNHDPVNSGNVGLTASGGTRTFTERSGMVVGAPSGAILIDNGLNTLNPLSPELLRNFENNLPVRPPMTISAETARGRVGSFSLSAHKGWLNAPLSQPMSEDTIYLPGAEVLDGWQATAFIAALEVAVAAAFSGTPVGLLSYFVDISTILDACDRYNVTLGLGPSISGGVGAGAGFGFGIVFAPGRKIGFYGSKSAIVGWVGSAGISAQVTVIQGGHQNFGGNSYLAGVSIETVGWFTTGLLGVPIGAHAILNTSGQPIGYTFEIGVSAGIPVYSLIEAYGQYADTTTTFGYPASVDVLQPSTDTGSARQSALNAAIAAGAPPAEATAFVDSLFI